MNLFPAMSKKRREAAAREFLSNPRIQNDGRPPIPADSVVELKAYGCVWKGASAVRVALLGNQDVAMDFRLAFQGSGPDAAAVILSPEHAVQVVECAARCQADLNALKRLISGRASSPAKGGAGPLSERDVEILRIFRLELGSNGGVLAAVRRAPAESGNGK